MTEAAPPITPSLADDDARRMRIALLSVPAFGGAGLVVPARAVMDTDVAIAPADAAFDAVPHRPDHRGAIRHVLVTENDRVIGVLRANTGLRRGLEAAETGTRLRDVAHRGFIVVGEADVMFDVIGRLWDQGATMAVAVAVAVVVVVRDGGPARAQDVLGIIAKEHVADAVAGAIKLYN